MDTRIVWQILSTIWLLIALYFGGLNLLLGLSALRRPRAGRGPGDLGWFNVILGTAVLCSGFVAFIVAFDPAMSVTGLAEQMLLSFALIALLVVSVPVSFRGEPSSLSVFSRQWTRIRVPARLSVATIAIALAIVRDDPVSRTVLILLGMTQVALIVMDVVFDRADRGE